MSYSSVLSMVSAVDSSSLDALTAQFAHMPTRRMMDASSHVTTNTSTRSLPTAAETAFLPRREMESRDSIYPTFSSTRRDCFTSSRPNVVEIHDANSDFRYSDYDLSSSSSSSSVGVSADSTTAGAILPISGQASPDSVASSGNAAPSTSVSAASDSLAMLGSGADADAQKNLFAPLAKFDSEPCRGSGVYGDADARTRTPVVCQSAPRVETVEWHMLDKLKFYPMSTTCSFMIRGMLYPFTLIKTRIQIQEQTVMYKGTYDALRKIYASEGVGGFYRGFWVNSIQVFSGIFYISTYEGIRHLMATKFDVHDLILRAFVGGLCASVVGQMITVPFDVVSQHMMVIGASQHRGVEKLKIVRNDPIHVSPEALKTRFGVFQTIVREIYARHGMPGYYRGYWISIGTYAPNSALWWGFYHWYIDVLSKMLPSAVPALMVQSCSAPAAGLSAAVLTNPIDVVRARVQVEGSCSAREAATRLWQEEKYKMFTKGLSARFIQSSFFSFLIILGYETVKRLSLKEEYKNSVPW